MTRANGRTWTICIPLGVVGMVALVHYLYAGAYVVGDRTFWIGPISTTLPFALCAVVFWAHALSSGATKPPGAAATPIGAYWGAGTAAGLMLAFTLWVISLAPGPEHSSTMAIAVVLTSVFYFALLAIGYAAGVIACILWSRAGKRTR